MLCSRSYGVKKGVQEGGTPNATSCGFSTDPASVYVYVCMSSCIIHETMPLTVTVAKPA